jgi:hypothetical protein
MQAEAYSLQHPEYMHMGTISKHPKLKSNPNCSATMGNQILNNKWQHCNLNMDEGYYNNDDNGDGISSAVQ